MKKLQQNPHKNEMHSPSFQVSMPSNIALIKYMGKKNSHQNIPSNSSLSYTLNHLTTTVNLTPLDIPHDRWSTAQQPLNNHEKNKFITHLDFLRKTFHIKQYYLIASENNFPASCGLASSASSFAALTACAIKAFGIKNITREEMALLSQRGSGSSCRSFFSPFAIWNQHHVAEIKLPYYQFIHHVIVVSKSKKLISSREAHALVQSSLLFQDRYKRASFRLKNLLHSFEQKDWEKSYQIIWQEFWDLHALFETCESPFGYILPETLTVLAYIRKYWKKNQDGPLVTMDAGPNIHLLFREDQQQLAQTMKQFFQAKYIVL